MNLSKVFKNNETLFLYLTVIFLTLISSRFIYNNIINVNELYTKERLEHQNVTLEGKNDSPYQYRLLQPVLTKLIQEVISPVIKNEARQHLLASEIIMFVTLFGIFSIFSSLLRLFYSTKIAIIGLLILQIIIIQSTNRVNQDPEFYNLLLYVASFYLMFGKKENYLPVIFLIGAFNHEQFIFMNVFYLLYLVGEKRLLTKKGLIILLANALVYFAVYFGLRFYFGFRSPAGGMYNFIFCTSYNIQHWKRILRIWAELYGVIIIMCLIAYKKCIPFFKYSFLSLAAYYFLFFTHGALDEPAKFFPALAVLIPMCLMIFNNELKKEAGS